jgi:hypothetical protein
VDRPAEVRGLLGAVRLEEESIEPEDALGSTSSLQVPAMPDPFLGPAEAAQFDAEAFLETIFGPLRGQSETINGPRSRASRGPGRPPELRLETRPPVDGESLATTKTLRVRVPGANFELTEDETSTVSSEAAIDLRSALSRYQTGRRDAAAPDRDS